MYAIPGVDLLTFLVEARLPYSLDALIPQPVAQLDVLVDVTCRGHLTAQLGLLIDVRVNIASVAEDTLSLRSRRVHVSSSLRGTSLDGPLERHLLLNRALHRLILLPRLLGL